LGQSKGQVRRVAIGPEANRAPPEDFNGGKGRVGSRTPFNPNPTRSLTDVHVASSFFTLARFGCLACTQWAVAADETVATGLDGGNGILGTDQDPNLDHVPGLPVLGFAGEACRDYDAICVLVDDVAVCFHVVGFGVWGLGFGVWGLGFGV